MKAPKQKPSVPYNLTPAPPSIASEPVVAYHASAPSFMQTVRKGVPRKKVTEVQASFGLSQYAMAALLHMSERTLQRYQDEDLMDVPASEKLLLLQDLQKHGIKVFGSNSSFTSWLHDEIPSLGFKQPISYLDTFTGIQTIDQLLGRLEWGMF
jgi:putative toxin-antitoxin system antitoxin component (TIGR02293 family)